jgi:hypothetical protein
MLLFLLVDKFQRIALNSFESGRWPLGAFKKYYCRENLGNMSANGKKR